MSRKRACDSCRRKKIQCDRVLPQCNWCKHHDLACTFDRKHGPRKSNARYVSGTNLTERIDRMELALNTAQRNLAAQGLVPSASQQKHLPSWPQEASKTSTDTLVSSPEEALARSETTLYTAPLTSSSSSPSFILEMCGPPDLVAEGFNLGKLHLVGYQLGDMSWSNGIPFFSKAGLDWIRFWTGEEPSFNQPDALVRPWETQYQGRPLPSTLGPARVSPDINLPTRDVMEHFVFLYCSTGFHCAFPIIDPILFGHTLDAAYTSNRNPSSDAVDAKACLFSFMSLVSLCQTEWRSASVPSVDGSTYATKLQSLVPLVFLQATITNLQTTVMLCVFYLFSGDPHHGRAFHSLACRNMFALGAHLNPTSFARGPQPTQPSTNARGAEAERTKTHLRQLFWLVYSLDKEISLRTGHPPSIDDDYCDLTIPEPPQGQKLSGELDGDGPHRIALPYNLHLAIVKSKVCKKLYSESALRKQNAEILRDIREMDDELERWRLSVPAAYRPNLGFSSDSVSNFSPSSDSGDSLYTRTHRNMAQFEYLYLVAAIHRASGRCHDLAHGESGDLEGISSSIAISVQASRSAIVHLRAAVNVVAEKAFWTIVFYPTSAAVMIFCNIILDPLDPQAREDLQLISSVPQLIQSILRLPRSPKDELYVQIVDTFFVELIRIANCAVAKAMMT